MTSIDTLLFPFAQYWWLYGSFLGLVALLLALDLGVFHRQAHVVRFREAAGWSVFWVLLSLGLNYAFYRYALNTFSTDPSYLAIPGFDPAAAASRAGMEFLTGYVIEKALAIDNIFVFVMVFAAFKIPAALQHRVLFFGILGAIAFRALFIAAGARLMDYHWMVILFGAFLILTGVKMLFLSVTGKGGHDPQAEQSGKDIQHGWQMRLISKFIPLTPELSGKKFVVRRNGAWVGTPLLVALVMIEFADIIFAVDSVPAIFAVTREPLIVFISNILAILGLRSMYFLISGVVDRFVYLKHGLALVLVFVGAKMAWLNTAWDGKFPIGLSLGIIGVLIFGSIGISLLATAGKGGARSGLKQN